MTHSTKNAPAAVGAAAGAENNPPVTTTTRSSEMTVPTSGPAPEPPDQLDTALVFDRASNLLTLADGDLTAVLQQLRDDQPLWVSVDVVAALGHLRAAARLVDRAAERIEAQAVTR